MLNAKKYKKEQVEIWSAISEVYDHSFSALMHPASLQMLERAGVSEGQEVLDLASGTGLTTFLAASRLGEKGRVVGVDLTPKMVELATAKAQTRGASNASFQVMDAEQLSFKDESFDVVLSKLGLVLFTDCHKALKEAYRVLRPGGRIAGLVFGRPEGSQFLMVAARAAAKHLVATVSATDGAPTDFQFAADGAIEAAFNAVGFTGVSSRRFAVMITCPSADAYWDLLLSGAATFSHRLKTVAPEIREAIIRDVKQSVGHYHTGEGIRLPVEVVIGYGEKPRKGKDAARAAGTARSIDDLLATEAPTIRQVEVDQWTTFAGSNGVILDVRPRAAYASGNIPGSISIPRGRLEAGVPNLIRDAFARILVVSDDGRTGIFACKALSDVGYREVFNLAGGFQAWKSTAGRAS